MGGIEGEAVAAVDRAWCEIEAWYAARDASALLHPGSTAETIARAETRLGLEFPEPLRALLRRHDGSLPNAWATGTLLSCGRIVAATELWRRIAARGEEVPRDFVSVDAERGYLQPGWWHRGWLAIDEDAHGNATAVDTTPGRLGRPGQVLTMRPRGGASLAAWDLADYLRDAADQLADLRVVDGTSLEEDEAWRGSDDTDLAIVFDARG